MRAAGALSAAELASCAAPSARQQRMVAQRAAAPSAARSRPRCTASLNPSSTPPQSSRRAALASLAALCASVALLPLSRADGGPVDDDALAALQAGAATAFAAQDFAAAETALSALIAAQPQNAAWVEGRAQVRVDAKRFDAALADFDAALALIGADEGGAGEARLRAGRALALEGLSRWPEALADYDVALASAAKGGFLPDPYILNSRGNVLASLGRWADAREAYTSAAGIFQASKGYRRGSSTTSRLDGAIYATANAALMRAQLGDDEGAAQDLAAVARRAPNSADARAALAALRWSAGRRAEAEEAWDSACGRNEGCARYKDIDYVQRIRRWPPRMVKHLQAFLQLRDEAAGDAPP